MKKIFMVTMTFLALMSSFSVLAQSIDTGYETNPSTYFTATGLDENGSRDVAEAEMRSNTHRACGYDTRAQQISATRFRTVYTYLHASAEFKCSIESDRGASDHPLPSRRCWYFDDSNPYCSRNP